MSADIDKIDELFRALDERRAKQKEGSFSEEPKETSARIPLSGNVPPAPVNTNTLPTLRTTKINTGSLPQNVREHSGRMEAQRTQPQPTTDAQPERKQRALRINTEHKSGCLGGLMYFTFIACLSVLLACLAWMCASDMLALNKDKFNTVVTLPMSIFQSSTVDEYDDDGKVTGTKRITKADMGYVSDALKDAGLIEYKWLFKLFCSISNADTKVSPGEYELNSTYDYRALIQHMRENSGVAETVKVTIPEGYTMNQLFLKLEEERVCDYDDLMAAAAEYKYNYSFLEGHEPGDASRLEGYLFPDTYEFYVNMQASSAINKFLDTFYYRMSADRIKQAQNLGLTIDQVITVASLIEKEAANDSERGLIASVIYNRLNSGIVLGIDASILYVHQDHEGSPTADMLVEDSPYNTRIKAGLPPTPICNPGLASIDAALNPEYSSYYFYALDTATGVHRFFTNETEFGNFVATQNYE